MRIGSSCYYVVGNELKYGPIVEIDTHYVYMGRYFRPIPKDRVFETRGEAQTYIDNNRGFWYNVWKTIAFWN